jgi:hypothetical protein
MDSETFKSFYTSMPAAERDAFAVKAATTRGLCNQIAFAGKKVELGMADVFVTLSGGRISLDGIPLTDRAKAQRAIREGAPAFEPTPLAA